MAWTTPKTNWATGELVTAEDMNAVGENLAAIETRRSSVAVYTTTEDIDVVSTDFVDVDSENLNLTITTTGGDVLVHFEGVFQRSINFPTSSIDVVVDGNRQGGDNGLVRVRADQANVVSFTRLIQNLSAGMHAFKLQWKVGRSGFGMRLHAGAQFWVREI